MAGSLYKDCVIEVNSNAISGQANTVRVTATRAVIESVGFGEEEFANDVGAEGDRMSITAYYTEGAKEAYAELYDVMKTPGSGVAVAAYPSGKTAGNKYFSATMKVASLSATISRTDSGMIEAELVPTTGGIDWATYSTT